MKEFKEIMKEFLTGKKVKVKEGVSYYSYDISESKTLDKEFDGDTIITIDSVDDGEAYEELYFLVSFIRDGVDCTFHISENTELEIIKP